MEYILKLLIIILFILNVFLHDKVAIMETTPLILNPNISKIDDIAITTSKKDGTFS